LLANPRTLFLGAAAQFGIFATLLGALAMTELGWMDFSLREAAAIGIIGGADGPTAIYVAGQLAPNLLGAIAVAAYSYMALVPMIQPPIMRLLTTESERKIKMEQLREVSQPRRSSACWLSVTSCGNAELSTVCQIRRRTRSSTS
jgi:oxaloacetate decarboxylase beta subunit